MMKLGIIGLDSSGKTTIFEALTRSAGGVGQKTESRVGTIAVPDNRLNALSRIFSPQKTIFAQVEYFLPGIADQQKEKGRDPLRLNQVRDCDALILVVRNFQGYGFGPPSPLGDFSKLNLEMILSDFLVVERRIERLEADRQRGKKENSDELSVLKQCLTQLENEEPLRKNKDLANLGLLKGFALLSAKPLMLLFNNDDDDQQTPSFKDQKVEEEFLVIRGKLEQEISQMSTEEAGEFLQEFGIIDTAMDRVVQKSYELQGLISFFTVGADEVRAWTIKKGSSAISAAGAIHSDMAKGFIRAEVIGFDDFMTAGSLPAAKKLGTMRLEGKNYVVQDGDIISIRFNV